MKIVAISGSQVPSSAANSIQTMKAVHALAQLGHEITLIVPLIDAESSVFAWDELADYYGLQQHFQIEFLPSASRRLFFLSSVRRAKKLKPDLLYVWPLQSAVLGLVSGLPVLLELHDLPSGRIGPFWFRYLRDIKGAKRIAVITKALQSALIERYGAQFRHSDMIIAPNGVELERFERLPDVVAARASLKLPEAPTVMCTGHLYSGRGVELFVALARKFQERGIQFTWVGGKPEDVQKWREQTKDISNVNFRGFIPNSQLPVFQAAADVLLMPYGKEIGISSGVGHSAQVSSPMKMFEYMATGRVILASDLPVFHEILNQKNAVFCTPDDVGSWETALNDLLDHPQRREEISAQARTDAQKYSWLEREKTILEGFPAKTSPILQGQD